MEQPTCPPPAYTSLPQYSARASSSECVLLASHHGVEPQVEIDPAAVDFFSNAFPSTYKTSFKRIELNLGPRIFNSAVPVYGHGAPIEGFVQIKKHLYVSRVDVSIEGRAYAVYVDHGLTTLQKSYELLRLKTTVYSRPGATEPCPDQAVQYPFTFELPSDHDLPPSCSSLLPRIEARVWYFVKVDMYRAGFRTHITVQMPILYLPRSRPPPPLPGTSRYISLSSALDTKLSGIDTAKWNTVNIASNSGHVGAQFSLPNPLIYASGQTIPFVLNLSSQSQADPDPTFNDDLDQRRQEFMSHTVTLQLVKAVTLQVDARRSRREYILQAASIWRDELCNAYQSPEAEVLRRCIRGTIKAGKTGGEVNWNCRDMIDVRYSIRITIELCSQSSMPTLTHDQPISLTTHDLELPGTPREGSLPALSLRRPWR